MSPTWWLLWLLLAVVVASEGSLGPRLKRGFGASRYGGGARGYEVREQSGERDASVSGARGGARGDGRGGAWGGSDSDDDDSDSESRELGYIRSGHGRTAYSAASASASASASARDLKYNSAA